LNLKLSSKYKKEHKRIFSSGYRTTQRKAALVHVLNRLLENNPLESKYRDHVLINEYEGHRECHIEPDLLLIYFIDLKNELIELARIGSHSELFK
jgi:mRNA interferase YafQ